MHGLPWAPRTRRRKLRCRAIATARRREDTTEDATDVGVEDVRAARCRAGGVRAARHIARVARDARGDSPRDAEDDLGRTRARARSRSRVRAASLVQSPRPSARRPPRVMRPRPTPRRPAASRVTPPPRSGRTPPRPRPAPLPSRTGSPRASPSAAPASSAAVSSSTVPPPPRRRSRCSPPSSSSTSAATSSPRAPAEHPRLQVLRGIRAQPLVVQGTRGGAPCARHPPRRIPSRSRTTIPTVPTRRTIPTSSATVRCSTARSSSARASPPTSRSRSPSSSSGQHRGTRRAVVQTRRARVAAVERFRGEGLRRTRGGHHRGRQRRGGIRRGRSVNRVVQTVRASGATPLRLSLLREGAPVNVDVTPNVSPAGEGRIGVQLEANAEMTKRTAKNAAEGAGLAAKRIRTTRGARVQIALLARERFRIGEGERQRSDRDRRGRGGGGCAPRISPGCISSRP